MSKKYPKSVLTENKSGKTEVRTLVSKGKFAMCEYSDPQTLKRSDKKRKLILKRNDGRTEEYFIIPMNQKNKDLLITPSEKSGKYTFWNEAEGEVEKL